MIRSIHYIFLNVCFCDGKTQMNYFTVTYQSLLSFRFHGVLFKVIAFENNFRNKYSKWSLKHYKIKKFASRTAHDVFSCISEFCTLNTQSFQKSFRICSHFSLGTRKLQWIFRKIKLRSFVNTGWEKCDYINEKENTWIKYMTRLNIV